MQPLKNNSDEESQEVDGSQEVDEEDESTSLVQANLQMFRRNPQLLKVLILAGLQQGFCNLANTFVLSDMKAQYWGSHMSEYQSVASIMINLVAVICGGPYGRFSDGVDRRLAAGLFAAGTFLPGWALQIFGGTSSALWLCTVAQIIGSFALTSNVMFSLATDVTCSRDREVMAGAYFAFLCAMNVVLIAIPVLLILVLQVVPNNKDLIVGVQTCGTALFFFVLCTVKAEKLKEEHHDNEMWFAENGAQGDAAESQPPASEDFQHGIIGMLKGFFQPFVLAFGHRRLRRLCLTNFMLAFGGNLVSDIGGQFFNQTLGLLPTAEHPHPDPDKIVMVSVYSMLPGQLMAIPGNIITGYIAKLSGPLKLLRTLIPLAALLVAAGALMAAVKQMWFIAVVVICLTYAGLPNVPLQRIVAGVAPPGRTGEALAAAGVFQQLAGLLGNMVVASLNPLLLNSSLPNPLWVYYPACGALVLLGLLPLLGTPRGGWGTATGQIYDQIRAISWADGALYRWSAYAQRQHDARKGHGLSSYLQGQDNDIQVDLPEATREECIAAFALFDRNKSGQITKEEIGELLKAAGQFPTEEDIEDLVEQLDADGSGGLNLAEFLEVVSANPKGRDLSAELIEAFKILDEDADGFLSKDELRKAAKKFHSKLLEQDILQMVAEADSSFDGKISFPEFERIMKWGLSNQDH